MGITEKGIAEKGIAEKGIIASFAMRNLPEAQSAPCPMPL
jgi:hypothetical protein